LAKNSLETHHGTRELQAGHRTLGSAAVASACLSFEKVNMPAFSLRACAAVVSPVLVVSALLLTTSPAQATSPSALIPTAAQTIAQIQGASHISPFNGKL